MKIAPSMTPPEQSCQSIQLRRGFPWGKRKLSTATVSRKLRGMRVFGNQENVVLHLKGVKDAQSRLASLYYHGWGVEKDLVKAVYWYRKAAAQESFAAQMSLGWCYEFGCGVKRDLNRAAMWYARAAENDADNDYLSPAQTERRRRKAEFHLARVNYKRGVCFETGDGEEKDAEAAAMCYSNAAAMGYEPAKEALKRLGYY